MSNNIFLKSLFLICLIFMAPNAFSATFNASNTPQLRQALLDAGVNGQDDTIVLAAGIYKTTSDDLGTFVFFDSEAFKLTIIGAANNRDEVVLDGDNTDQVLSLNAQRSKV